MGFVGTFQRLASTLGPYYINGPNVGRFRQAVALTLDDAAQTLWQGLNLSNPLTCDVSALPKLSVDRKIRLYPNEPELSKRYRLANWHQLRRQFGTQQGALRNLQPFFAQSIQGVLPNITLAGAPMLRAVHQDGAGAGATWHTLDSMGKYSVHRATPSNWNWDGVSGKWSRCWVIVYLPVTHAAQPVWDGGQFWDGGPYQDGGDIWDGLFTADEYADMVAALTDAQAPHETYWGLIIATDPASFDPTASIVVNGDGTSNLPDGKWGFVIDNATGKPSRLASAVFPYDLGQG